MTSVCIYIIYKHKKNINVLMQCLNKLVNLYVLTSVNVTYNDNQHGRGCLLYSTIADICGKVW